MQAADAILEFWFGEPATDTATLGRQIKRWYMGGAELDREICARFQSVVEQAIAGALVEWEAPLASRLALVLVLDQFTRSVFRDDPRAFAGDGRAQRLAVDAIDRGLHRELAIERRNFLLMPLAHAEDRALQERSVVEVAALFADAAEWQRPIFAMGVEQSKKYRDVIARFGRFPHRNAVLGRTSTPEETAFLVDWKDRQRPAGSTSL